MNLTKEGNKFKLNVDIEFTRGELDELCRQYARLRVKNQEEWK